MSTESLTITIDGAAVKATANQTILQAAEAAGIYIPHLCELKGLPPAGHCRICTVRVDGRPASACTFPVSDGLVIENDTEELTDLRRGIIEMLFVEGNHFCPSCEASGDCELQALAYRLGMVAPTLPYLNKKQEIDASHPELYIDRSRCVLCGRCTRASQLEDGKTVFGFEERGIAMRLAVNSAKGLSDTELAASDRAASACPVGCLVRKREGYKTPYGQRTYDHAPIGSEIENG